MAALRAAKHNARDGRRALTVRHSALTQWPLQVKYSRAPSAPAPQSALSPPGFTPPVQRSIAAAIPSVRGVAVASFAPIEPAQGGHFGSCFSLAAFTTAEWGLVGALQLLRWVAPTLPPPGLRVVERMWKGGNGPFPVAMTGLFSRTATFTPEHTDATASVLAVVAGSRKIVLREAAPIPPMLECRGATVLLQVGDCLLIPAGLHHSVEGSKGSIGLSMEVAAIADHATFADIARPCIWRNMFTSWRTPKQWASPDAFWAFGRSIWVEP